MRTLALVSAVLLLAVPDTDTVAAQEIGEPIALTGCLAQEDDDEEVEHLLQDVDPRETAATEIELVPIEGLSLAEHVGHRVEVTGTVVADDEDEQDEAEEPEEEHDDEGEIVISVTELRHIAAACSGGR